MFETYAELVAYFEALPDTITELKGATVGNDEALLEQQNTRIKYPHLWVESPEVVFSNKNASSVKRFDLALAVISNEPRRSAKDANTKLSEMLTLAEQVYEQLLTDSDAGLFDLIEKENDASSIRQWSADNCWGWRLEVSIEMPRCECGDC